MNWQAIGVVAEVVSAIAVVVSLVYLAMQIRQSARQARADNVQATVERWIEAQTSRLRSEDDAEFLRNALSDYTALSVPQKARLAAFMFDLTAAFQAMYVKHRNGLLDPDLYAAVHDNVAGYMKCPGLAGLWQELKFSYPKDLAREIDSAIEAHQGLPFTETLPHFQPDA